MYTQFASICSGRCASANDCRPYSQSMWTSLDVEDPRAVRLRLAQVTSVVARTPT